MVKIIFASALAMASSTLVAEEIRLKPPKELAAAAAEAPHLFLLAVGVDAFDDRFWPRLKWAENDARAVAATVGVDTGYTRVVTTRLGAAATKDAVNQALDAVEKAATSRDVIVIYVSTHGTLMPTGGGDLAPVLVLKDTTASDLERTGLSHDDLRRRLLKMRSARKLLVLAACNAGVGKSRLPPRVQNIIAGRKGVTAIAPLAEVSEGTLILAAAANNEAAREDDTLKGDIYTHFFLEGLATYDRDRDGTVSALEAHDYAKERTFIYTQGHQRPTAEALFIGDADVPLKGRRVRSGLPVLDAYGEDLSGLDLKVGRGIKGRLPSAFPLADGVNHIELYRAGEEHPLAAYRVAASAGDHVTLDDVLARPRWTVALGAGAAHFLAPAAQHFAGAAPLNLTTEARWRARGPLELSLGYDWLPTATHEARPHLTAKLQEDGVSLGAIFCLPLNPDYDARIGAFSSYRRAVLTLTSGDEALEKTIYAQAYGFSIGGARAIFFGLSLEATAKYLAESLAFDHWGVLPRTRLEGVLGISYGFGGAAMKVPSHD